ncbi:MAG TPA: UDP-3-O-(3-hydroxymyristoyl)glucosamine N-acyltransferase [Longimicrobiales bacterium]
MRLSEIQQRIGGRRTGSADPEIRGVASLERAGESDLSFVADPRYLGYLAATRAGALLVTSDLVERVAVAGRPALVVDDGHRALADVLGLLYPPAPSEPGVHPSAVIAQDAELGADVRVDAYAVIGAGARIGARAWIGPHVVVGRGCVIGDDVVLHGHATLYDGVRIGPRSILHSGVRAGVDGFGYVHVDGAHRKVPQVGSCVIGADVEIGANSTIDRGSIGATEIGDGVKIDNLVHVGHNVRVGPHAIIVAQAGIAGSTQVGRYAVLGGQAGIGGHVKIGDGAQIAGQAGVFGDVPAGAVYSGYPARPHKEALRAQAALFRLPDLLKRLKALERRLGSTEEADGA